MGGGFKGRISSWLVQSDAQVGRLRVALSAWGLDMRICELLLLRMESCVPPFTPLLASEGWRCCFRSTAKYLFTVQLRHFLLISDCTFRQKLEKVIRLMDSAARV